MLCFFHFIKSDLFRKFVINNLEFFYRNKRMKPVTEKQYTMQQTATICTRL